MDLLLHYEYDHSNGCMYCGAGPEREPAQPVPLGDCGHPAWTCSCRKWREPITRDEDDPTVQHEPVTEEGY